MARVVGRVGEWGAHGVGEARGASGARAAYGGAHGARVGRERGACGGVWSGCGARVGRVGNVERVWGVCWERYGNTAPIAAPCCSHTPRERLWESYGNHSAPKLPTGGRGRVWRRGEVQSWGVLGFTGPLCAS